MQIVYQQVDRFRIPVGAVPLDRCDAGGADKADPPERFAGVRIADVNFNGGNPDRLQRIEQCDAGVRIGAGIDHDPVRGMIGCLNAVNKISFMIGLVNFNVNALSVSMGNDFLAKSSVSLISVNLRFPKSEQIQIRSVYDQYLHQNAFFLFQTQRRSGCFP